jgi:hypothetical protein
LGVFGALGVERAHVPPDFSTRHYLTFTFPYSHGLVVLIGWGLLFGAIFCWVDRQDRVRAFWVLAALVFSHFILDGLVHVPELAGARAKLSEGRLGTLEPHVAGTYA